MFVKVLFALLYDVTKSHKGTLEELAKLPDVKNLNVCYKKNGGHAVRSNGWTDALKGGRNEKTAVKAVKTICNYILAQAGFLVWLWSEPLRLDTKG